MEDRFRREGFAESDSVFRRVNNGRRQAIRRARRREILAYRIPIGFIHGAGRFFLGVLFFGKGDG